MALDGLINCLTHQSCSPGQTTVVILASWHFSTFLVCCLFYRREDGADLLKVSCEEAQPPARTSGEWTPPRNYCCAGSPGMAPWMTDSKLTILSGRSPT
jgi:hypothetical protein